jgi:hypothetical protein
VRPVGEHGFDQVHREDAGDLPRRQDEGGEGRSVFHRTQQPLQRWIIIAYAGAQAQHRACVSCGVLGEECQKRTAFSLLC